LSRHAVIALLACLALAAGCGDDDDDGSGGSNGSSGGSGSAAQLDQAESAMKKDDYDGALAILKGLGDDPEARQRAAEYRVEAATETLANARRKSLKTEPRAAMSLAKTSLRYHPTPEARAFLAKATRAHAVFKRSGRDDD
jgi:hypothetical protein